jgi:fructoselysine-6-P-deglycase FrlB-like protein
MQSLGKAGDVLLAISASGKSKNVILAPQMAKEMGMKVIALTGACGANDAGERRAVRQPAGNSLPGFGLNHEAPFGEQL